MARQVAETLRLNNGMFIPRVGLGTFLGAGVRTELSPEQTTAVTEAIKTAIDSGYRHFDTAALYGTEKAVGLGIRAKIEDRTIDRQDVFVTTKLWSTNHRPELVEPALRESLTKLGLDYVDLYLIHWPVAYQPSEEHYPRDAKGEILYDHDLDLMDTWKAMEACQKKGLTKSLGLSNFSCSQVQRVLDICEVKPVINQVECHPFFTNEKLVDFCLKQDVVVACWSPIAPPHQPGISAKSEEGRPLVVGNQTLTSIGEKYNKTAVQVALRFQLQRGLVVVAKSFHTDRQKQNQDVFDFNLSDEEMQTILQMNRNRSLTFSLAYEVLETSYRWGPCSYRWTAAVIEATKTAIDSGYRHFDTAAVYGTEEPLGQGIRAKIEDGTIVRQDVFVTTKLWNTSHRPELVEPALRKSLTKLGLDYLDLYLVHWPVAYQPSVEPMPTDANGKILYDHDLDLMDTWKAMEACQKKGLTKSVGLSNFSCSQVQRVLDICEVKPVINQVECHPFFTEEKIVDFCLKHDVAVACWSPIAAQPVISPTSEEGRPLVVGNQTLTSIGENYSKTAVQVALRFQLQRGLVVVPKSFHAVRQKQNRDIFDFNLSDEDMQSIFQMDRNESIVSSVAYQIFGGSKEFPFKTNASE